MRPQTRVAYFVTVPFVPIVIATIGGTRDPGMGVSTGTKTGTTHIAGTAVSRGQGVADRHRPMQRTCENNNKYRKKITSKHEAKYTMA
jgi:hypothetical protein